MEIRGYEDCIIVDDHSLLKACDYIHNARFDISLLKIDLKEGIINATFNQDYLEDNEMIEKSRYFIFEKWTFPFIKIKLELNNISDYQIQDHSNIGTYSFNECRIRNNRYRLLFNESMEINLKFKNKPNGKLTVLGLTEEKETMYTFLNIVNFKHNN